MTRNRSGLGILAHIPIVNSDADLTEYALGDGYNSQSHCYAGRGVRILGASTRVILQFRGAGSTHPTNAKNASLKQAAASFSKPKHPTKKDRPVDGRPSYASIFSPQSQGLYM